VDRPRVREERGFLGDQVVAVDVVFSQDVRDAGGGYGALAEDLCHAGAEIREVFEVVYGRGLLWAERVDFFLGSFEDVRVGDQGEAEAEECGRGSA
jgi:hypothetical protein